MMGRKERSSPRPKKELLDQASSVETKEIRCQMPGPMDRKEIWKPKGKRKLAWSAWENLETHSFYDPIAFPDHNLEPLVITCWFQRLMVQDSTAITGYAIYRGFRLAFPFPVLFIWPGERKDGNCLAKFSSYGQAISQDRITNRQERI